MGAQDHRRRHRHVVLENAMGVQEVSRPEVQVFHQVAAQSMARKKVQGTWAMVGNIQVDTMEELCQVQALVQVHDQLPRGESQVLNRWIHVSVDDQGEVESVQVLS